MRGYFECEGCGGDFHIDGASAMNINGNYICDDCANDAARVSVGQVKPSQWADSHGYTGKWNFSIDKRSENIEIGGGYYYSKYVAWDKACNICEKLFGDDCQIIED